jgi:CRP-like cAMP-binding protein
MLEGQDKRSPAYGIATRSSLAGTRLACLSGEERRTLEAAASPVRPFRAGTDLIREGGLTNRLYIVARGWAYRFKTTRGGSRQIVALLVPGDIANLDSLMLDRPDYGVRALTAAELVAIPRERALALAGEHAGIAKALARLAMVENANLSQWALCLGRHSAQQRIAHLLCELSARVTGSSEDPSSFELPMTQEQIADTVGLTPVHVNRTMQQLRSDGLIVTAGRSIMFPDAARLREVGEFDSAYLHIDNVGV